MRTCDACGFENAEPGKPCALCGSSEIVHATSDVSTIAAPATPTPAGGGGTARFEAGHVFGERYRVLSLLGSGGMGQVFRVEDQTNGQALALKVLLSLDNDDSDRVRRFQREIQVLTRIRHPVVLHILDWGRHGRDGSVRLLDFGLARGAGIDLTTLTRTGTILGTPGYMSPEQFDAHGVDERSDIYSLGVVLFEVLTGRLPFTGQTPIAVALAHKTHAPPLPRTLRPGVPAWLERVVLRCLEKDAARRFASASELAAELRRPREGAAPHARALPSGDRIVLDPAETTDWALVLTSVQEKTGWAEGMALRFEDRYYRLAGAQAPPAAGALWTYRFASWPEGEVFRRVVDYEQDRASRHEAASRKMTGRLSRWLGRRE